MKKRLMALTGVVEGAMRTVRCFELLPEVTDGKNIYIYGTDRRAFEMFIKCCSWRVEVKGFIDDYCSDIKTFFHKNIYKPEEISEEEKCIILAPWEKRFQGIGNVLFEDDILRRKLPTQETEFVIYGAGPVGRNMRKWLEEEGHSVKFFIETDLEEEKEIDGKPVYSQNMLELLPQSVKLIEAGKYWEEIDKIVSEIDSERERFYVETIGEIYSWKEKDNIILDSKTGSKFPTSHYLIQLEEHFQEKEIILYGKAYQELKLYEEVFRLLGYQDIVIAEDNTDRMVYATDCIDIYDVPYRDNYVVFLFDRNRKEKLKELGLRETIEFVNGYFPGVTCIREQLLDINIGQVFYTEEKKEGKLICPGIYLYGENKTEDYKILVLGDCTSDVTRDMMMSWPYILYQKCEENNMDISIFACGMSGYNSTQTLIRYIRDGIRLSPDLVIAYAGINDINILLNYGFENPMLRKVAEYVKDNCGQKITKGICDERSGYEKWLSNMGLIETLARAEGSDFICCMQPCIYSKLEDYMSVHEKKLRKMLEALYTPAIVEPYVSFRKNAIALASERDNYYNFTDIFDKEDVYCDNYHVYERGNRIIADRMYEILVERMCKDARNK